MTGQANIQYDQGLNSLGDVNDERDGVGWIGEVFYYHFANLQVNKTGNNNYTIEGDVPASSVQYDSVKGVYQVHINFNIVNTNNQTNQSKIECPLVGRPPECDFPISITINDPTNNYSQTIDTFAHLIYESSPMIPGPTTMARGDYKYYTVTIGPKEGTSLYLSNSPFNFVLTSSKPIDNVIAYAQIANEHPGISPSTNTAYVDVQNNADYAELSQLATSASTIIRQDISSSASEGEIASQVNNAIVQRGPTAFSSFTNFPGGISDCSMSYSNFV